MRKLKRHIKLAVASIFYYCGLLALIRMVKRQIHTNGDACVLMYHRVVDNLETDHDHTELGLLVSRDIFEKQIAYLSRNYNIVTLQTLAEAVKEGRKLPAKSVAISFDDGWRDNFTHAYPILKKYNAPAMIFLTTDFIGTDKVMWFHGVGLVLGSGKLAPEQVVSIVQSVLDEASCVSPLWLNYPAGATEIASDLGLLLENLKLLDLALVREIVERMTSEAGLSEHDWRDKEWILSWDDVRGMSPDIIQYGSHGQSHQIMTGLAPNELATELFESKAIIEGHIDQPIELLAYPNGNCSPAVIEQAKNKGYTAAFATDGSDNKGSPPNLFAIRRIGIHEGSSISASGRFSKVLFAFSLSNWRRFLEGSL